MEKPRKRRYSFYVPVLTPAGLEKLNAITALPGVRASATQLRGGLMETRQISFELDNKAALLAAAPFIKVPGVNVVTPGPRSCLILEDGTTLEFE
jgi:hypothetical protein